MKSLLVVWLSCTALRAEGGPQVSAPQIAAPQIAEDTRATLVNRVDQAKKSVGMFVGVVTPGGRAFAGYGGVSKGGAQPGANTMFEIGSLTKVFTALLLADMVERGEVAMDDPVAKYLPESVKVPSRDGRQITLADLTTHTSGLPRVPSNLDATSLDNPYADYDAAKLYAFLSGYTLSRDPGAQWEYSNLGVGLLGYALARRAGMSYEQLVKTRISNPLGMKSTTITLTAEQKARTATPHDEELKPVGLWDLDALAGAGAIRSTADDMLTFAAAHLGLIDSPLRAAMERMRAFRRPGAPGIEQAMGWLVLKPMGSEVYLHDGGTHGFRTALAIDPVNKRAAVAWTNSPLEEADFVTHVVEPRAPLAMLPPPRKEIQLPEETLATYAGEYQLAPTFAITITREGGRMFGQATGQTRFEIFAEKEGEFFLRAVDAQLTFAKDASGAVTGLVLHQDGRNTPGKKVR